jgi:oligopeptide transport system substrate-binding protein
MKRILLSAVAAMALTVAVTPASAQTPKQGGEVIVTFNNDLTTLDPQVGYDWQNWSVIKSIFDGLMDYDPGSTVLRPDMAESYSISDDGQTYTFKLRDGLKFHNGRAVTAADVKYSIERAVNPATQSPGGGYFSVIRGYDEMAGGGATELSGLTAPDDKTVVIQLNRPDATFLHVLALNFAFVVPKEEVEKAGANFGIAPVGTGAFKFAEWVPGQRLVLERFADYYQAGVPYLDKLTFEFGQDPTVAVLRLQKGEVDIVGDGIPPAQFSEVMSDPANKDLIAIQDQLQTGYVTLNAKLPPLDNVKVRQAINMAINKERILKLINNRGVVASQPLPPAMPGYDPAQKGYEFNPDKAKALLTEAGFPDGFDTELYAMNVDPNPRIAQAIQQDLAAIGVRAEVKSLAQAEVIAAGGNTTAPMIWSGGMAWIADFPDPANFYYGILGCASVGNGGWNWAGYCNEGLDQRANEADSMVTAEQAAARTEAWKGIFNDVMKDAPWVPVFNEKRFTYHSARLGGDDKLFTDPIHIPVNYDFIFNKDAQ